MYIPTRKQGCVHCNSALAVDFSTVDRAAGCLLWFGGKLSSSGSGRDGKKQLGHWEQCENKLATVATWLLGLHAQPRPRAAAELSWRGPAVRQLASSADGAASAHAEHAATPALSWQAALSGGAASAGAGKSQGGGGGGGGAPAARAPAPPAHWVRCRSRMWGTLALLGAAPAPPARRGVASASTLHLDDVSPASPPST